MKENMEKQPKKKISFSDLWNQKRIRPMIISAAVIILCAVLYLVLLFTVLKPEEEKQALTVGNHGEMMAANKPYIIPPLDTNLMLSIEVENEKGSYRYYKGEDQYYFEGAELLYYDQASDWSNQESDDLNDLIDSTPMVEALVSLVCNMLAEEEVVGYDKDNLAAYGLEGRGKAAVTLTYLDKDGKEVKNTVFFGNKTVDGTYYYVMLEGREALYILRDYYITRCAFAELKDYLLPQVAPSVSSSLYMEVNELSIKKKGQKFASLRKLTEEEYKEAGELFTHTFTFPEAYYPSADRLQEMLGSFVNFSGEEVMEYDIATKLADPDMAEEMQKLFRKYNLVDADNNWIYELYYKYDNFDITLYISEKLKLEGEEEGDAEYVYYIYSPDFDVIVEFKAENLSWVEWDILTLLDSNTFSVSIDQVASVEISYSDTKAKFTLQNTGDNLLVSSSNGVKVDTENFRQLYKAILFTTMEGAEERPEDASEILRVYITLRDGKVYDYVFYARTARTAYYTLNGSGKFFVNRDYVKQIISACGGILKGETVTVDRKN